MGNDPGAFDIKYMPRTSIKGQVLADFVGDDREEQCMDGKISWRGLLTRAIILEGVRRWGNESKGIWNRASCGIS